MYWGRSTSKASALSEMQACITVLLDVFWHTEWHGSALAISTCNIPVSGQGATDNYITRISGSGSKLIQMIKKLNHQGIFLHGWMTKEVILAFMIKWEEGWCCERRRN